MAEKLPISYRAPMGPPVTTALLGTALLAGSVALVLTAVDHGPWEFMALWVVVAFAVAYFYLYLTASEIDIADGRLRWRTAFRGGDLSMDNAEKVVSWPGGSVDVFKFRDGQKVRVAVMQGYVRFLEALNHEYPDLKIPPSVYARFVDQVRLHDREGSKRDRVE
ncbi:MAG: hypothetical protein WBA31_05935 [Candidatus Dormiibacterota bacterium]